MKMSLVQKRADYRYIFYAYQWIERNIHMHEIFIVAGICGIEYARHDIATALAHRIYIDFNQNCP